MKNKKVAVGCDHAGFELKKYLIEKLTEAGCEISDMGTNSIQSCNYPEFASLVCGAVTADKETIGLLVCGTGIGMSIAANKHRGIRAACCSDTYSARLTRMHNDSNVLCVGSRVVGPGLALDIVREFLTGEFEFGNHSKRVEMICKIEKMNDV